MYTHTHTHTHTKGRSLILAIRLFIFAAIYTRVPFTGYFSTFEEESRRVASSWWIGKNFIRLEEEDGWKREGKRWRKREGEAEAK